MKLRFPQFTWESGFLSASSYPNLVNGIAKSVPNFQTSESRGKFLGDFQNE